MLTNTYVLHTFTLEEGEQYEYMTPTGLIKVRTLTIGGPEITRASRVGVRGPAILKDGSQGSIERQGSTYVEHLPLAVQTPVLAYWPFRL